MGVEHVASLRDALVDVAGASHLSLLVGAGASASAGLPGWGTLVTRLLLNTGVVPDEATARSCREPGR